MSSTDASPPATLESLQARVEALLRERDEIREDALAAIQEGEAELTAVRSRVRSLQADLEQANAQAARAVRERDAALTRATAADPAAAAKAVEPWEARCRSLESEVASLRQQLRSQQQQAEQEFKRALEEKESLLQACSREVEAARTGHQQAEQRIGEVSRKLEALRAEKTALETALEKAREDAAGQLTAALQQKDGEFRALQARFTGLQGEVDALKKELEARARQGVAEEAKSRSLEAEIARLQARSSQDEADWQRAIDTVDGYRSQLDSSTRRIQELEAQLAARGAEVAARSQEAVLFKEQAAAAQGAINLLRSELQELRTRQDSKRDFDFLFTGITLLAQQARSGSSDFRPVLKALLQESEKMPEAAPLASAAGPAVALVPQRSTVQIVPPDALPGSGPVFGTTGHHLRQLEQVDLPGDIALTFDELSSAVYDAAWRGKWEAGHQPPAFLGHQASARGRAGERFHSICRQFLEWLLQPSGVVDAPAMTEKELWSTMYELFAAEPLNEMARRNEFEEANFLSRRLRTFCRRLAALKERTPAFHAWDDLLLPKLRRFERVVFPLQERRLVLSGTLHGLRSHPQGGYEVADWRVDAASDADEALEGAALAALLFHKAHPDQAFHTVVEHYTQDFAVREVPRADLNRVLRLRVVPVFYTLAGMAVPDSLSNPEIDFFPVARNAEVLHG